MEGGERFPPPTTNVSALNRDKLPRIKSFGCRNMVVMLNCDKLLLILRPNVEAGKEVDTLNRDKLLLVGPMYKELDELLLVEVDKEVDMIKCDMGLSIKSCL